MTPNHRRTARALTLTAGGTLAAGIYAAATHSWYALPALYIGALLAWMARCHHALHRRQVAEADWERRRVLGRHPAPLIPCCLLARHSEGQAHDHRCTNEFHRITAHPTTTDPGSST